MSNQDNPAGYPERPEGTGPDYSPNPYGSPQPGGPQYQPSPYGTPNSDNQSAGPYSSTEGPGTTQPQPPYAAPPSGGYSPYPYSASDSGGPSYPSGTFGAPGGRPERGFLGSLFDVSFTSFITPSVVKVAYIISMVIIGIFVLFGVIAALTSGDGLLAVFGLILAPAVGLFYLVLVRMTLEFYYATIRMSEDIHRRLPGGH